MPLLFALTITLSAFLLFLIQPMIAKQMLPLLGGGPSVWNTSMLFFQTLLLGGYAYAHFGGKWLGQKRHAIMHAGLLALSCLLLPLTLITGTDGTPTDAPVRWTFLTLLYSVGIPFFLLAANAPLLQRWYGQLKGNENSNPYILYSASNLGSFFALLGYPLFIEMLYPTSTQLGQWSIGYSILVASIALCALAFMRRGCRAESRLAVASNSVAPLPTAQTIARWVLLAFIPSSLMLGVTNFIATDIASFPLLWVIPLALYLLSFVITFIGFPRFQSVCRALYPWLITLAALLYTLKLHSNTEILFLHLIVFFIIAIVCHGILEKTKPATEHLTRFYLWMSVGGALGGLFNAIIAPLIFNSLIEYLLVLLLALLITPRTNTTRLIAAKPAMDYLAPLAIAALLLALYYSGRLLAPIAWLNDSARTLFLELADFASHPAMLYIFCIMVFVSVLSLLHFWRAKRALYSFTALALLVGYYALHNDALLQTRNFFGVSIVKHDAENNLYIYTHGTTNHGIQSRDEDTRLQPVSYYSPLKQIFDGAQNDIRSKPFAVLGQGVGTIACYGSENQHVDFYEIDPEVERIASNSGYFSYMKDCPPSKDVIIGDARIELSNHAGDEEYYIIVADAFSSDSVPVHLLTTEAISLYMQKLDENGLLAMHISNRHVDLKPILRDAAAELGLHIRYQTFAPAEKNPLIFPSHWVVLAKNEKALKGVIAHDGWETRAADPAHTSKAWSDDYSNILGAIVDKMRQ